MESMVLWGVGLFGFALAVFALELIIPSGGVLGILGLISLIGGCVAFWMESWILGMTSTIAVVVLGPIAVHFAIKVMPYTPVGKRLILGGPEDEEEERRLAELRRTEESAAAKALIGAEGIATTDLRPVGVADIEGTRVQVFSERGLVDRGTRVVVTNVQGTVVKVRPLP